MHRLGLLLCVAGLAAAAATSAYSARPIALGIAPDEAVDSTQVTHIASSGASMVAISADWHGIAPNPRPATFEASDPEDPAYVWTSLDSQVSAVSAAHLTPVIVFSGAPSWASSPGGIPSQGPWKPHVADVSAFATALATRYDGAHGLPRVRYFEIWNEPNLTRFLQPQYESGVAYSPLYYRGMLNAAARAIHHAAPGNLVVAGNLAPFTDPIDPKLSVPPMTFLRELMCMSADAHPRPICKQRATFDVLAMHPYTSGSPTHKANNANDVSLGNLPAVTTLLHAAWAAKRILATHAPRLWVSEISWDTRPPDPKGVPIALQARWTAESVYWMWRSGVSAAFWFSVRDEPFPQLPYQSGLYFAGWRPKPSLRAWRFPVVAYLDRGIVSVWGRVPAGGSQNVAIEWKHDGRWQRVARLRTGASGIFTSRLHVRASARDTVRAVTPRDSSLPFSLTRPAEHFYYPFGTS